MHINLRPCIPLTEVDALGVCLHDLLDEVSYCNLDIATPLMLLVTREVLHK